MTEPNNKYEKTWMYKILCNDPTVRECYVGHTTDFVARSKNHKSSCQNPTSREYNKPAYKFIRDNGGWANWAIHILETCKFNNRQEAEIRERDLVQILEASLNFEIPGRTLQEWRQDNKELLKIKQAQKYQQNKELMLQRDAKYYQKNKDKIQEKRKQRYECECCKCFVLSHTKARHEQTRKHQLALSRATNLENINVM